MFVINKDDKHFCGEKPHEILNNTLCYICCMLLLAYVFICLIKKQFANKSRKLFKSF